MGRVGWGEACLVICISSKFPDDKLLPATLAHSSVLLLFLYHGQRSTVNLQLHFYLLSPAPDPFSTLPNLAWDSSSFLMHLYTCGSSYPSGPINAFSFFKITAQIMFSGCFFFFKVMGKMTYPNWPGQLSLNCFVFSELN